jgi:hypothetical protein
MSHNFTGIPVRVRVQSVMKGPKKRIILLFYGKIRELVWDPARLRWPEKVEFLHYSTRLSRKLLRKRQPPLQLARRKWSPTLPDDFKFRWSTIWDHERQKKEVGLMWQIWHKAVVVNVWRGKISPNIDVSCTVCDSGQDETVLHRFWDCIASQQVWYAVTCLLKHLAAPTTNDGWNLPDWKQTIFAQRLPCKFHKVSRYWTLLKSFALWTIWLSRNDTSFNNVRWNQDRTKQVIWQSLCDCGRSAWCKVKGRIQKAPNSKEVALARFDSQWVNPAICTRVDMKIRWVKNWPTSIG